MKVTPARPELVIKFNQLPVEFTEEQGGGRTFELGGEGGLSFVVTLSKKSCRRLGKAAEDWPEWTAVVGGRFGEVLGPHRYRVESAGLINVLERKPKESTPEAAASLEPAPAEDASAQLAVAPPQAQAAEAAAAVPVRKTPSREANATQTAAPSAASSAAPIAAPGAPKNVHPFIKSVAPIPPPAPKRFRFNSRPIVIYRGTP